MQQLQKVASPENIEFLTDIQDLFSEKRFAHVGHWRYSEPLFKGDIVNGLHHWNNMIEDAKAAGKYYVFSDELELIQETIPDISKHIHCPITLVDLGPGSKEAVTDKIGYLINNINKPVSKYIGIDIVPEVLESTRSIFKEDFPFIEYNDLEADFFQSNLQLPQNPNVLMAIFGVTMFNLPIDPTDANLTKLIMTSLMKRMRLNLAPNSHFIVTQDCNDDVDDIIDSYKAQDTVWMNMLDRIVRDLPVSDGFKPTHFAFEPYYIPETSSLSHTYVCKTDMTFSIGDTSFELKQGQRFYLHNSYKFTTDYFCKIAKEVGFETVLTKKSGSNKMALHLLEAI